MNPCICCQHLNRPDAHFCDQCGAPMFLRNQYRITGSLGRDNHGAIYRAKNPIDNPCTIRELKIERTVTPQQEQRLRQEVSALMELSHSALPRVTDFFEEDNRHFLVTAYVEGDTLDEYLKRIPASNTEKEILTWAVELCDVLINLHSQKPPIIHGDIKLHSIIKTRTGKFVLTDRGIGKLIAIATGSAALVVSPPYAPIEQYRGKSDTRTDIYALGATLYQLLSGRQIPDAQQRPLARVEPLGRKRSPATQRVILKAIAEQPAERYQSTAEMKQDVQLALQALLEPPPGPWERLLEGLSGLGRWCWRQRWWLLVTFLLIACVAIIMPNLPQPPTLAPSPTVTSLPTPIAWPDGIGVLSGAPPQIGELSQEAKPVYGPKQGELVTVIQDSISDYGRGQRLRDFAIGIRFYNPPDASSHSWDYGIGFRDNEKDRQYRLYIRSDKKWTFYLYGGSVWDTLSASSGAADRLDVTATGSNHILLVAKENQGYLFVNKEFVTNLDLNRYVERGSLWIGTPFLSEEFVYDRHIRFEDLIIWSLE
jgi:serine/threonine protein kinase